jgi:S-adenosyl methyltransferase
MSTQRHRSRAEVARFFDGLDLVEPGMVPAQQWRPAANLEARARSAMWGGVARKPQAISWLPLRAGIGLGGSRAGSPRPRELSD